MTERRSTKVSSQSDVEILYVVLLYTTTYYSRMRKTGKNVTVYMFSRSKEHY